MRLAHVPLAWLWLSLPLALALAPLVVISPALAKPALANRHSAAFVIAMPAGAERVGLSVAFAPAERTLTLRVQGGDDLPAHVVQLPSLPSGGASSELVRLAQGEHALVLRFGQASPYVIVLLPPRVDEAAALAGAVVLKGSLGGSAGASASLDVVDGPDGKRLILSESAAESAGLCGRRARQTRALDPRRGRFVRVALPVLGAEERKKATKLVARSEAPAIGSSDLYLGPLPSAFETGELDLPALTDARFGASASPYEVALVSPSTELGLEALVVRVGDAALAQGAAWDLWLLTAGALVEVDTSGVRGAPTFVVDLPENLRSGCLGLAVSASTPIVEVTGRLASAQKAGSSAAALAGADGDRTLRELALVRPSVVPELARDYRSLHPLARARAESLARLAEPSDAEGFWVRQLIEGSEGEKDRGRTRLASQQDGGTGALERALRLASARDEATLARALAELSPAAALRPIASRLGQRSPARRLELRRVLAEIETEAAFLAELNRFLLDPAPARGQKVEVVRAVVPALGRLEPSARQQIVTLLKAAAFHDFYVLVPAALELAVTMPEAREILVGWLEDERKGVSERQLAALRTQVLGSALDRELAAGWISELAQSLLLDPFPRVRIAAASYLELAPTKAASEALQERLRRDEWPGMREAALGALASLRRDPEQGPLATAAMIRALAKDPAPSVRARAAHMLDRLPSPDTRSALRRSLDKDESAAVRAEAARALGLLCDRESTAALTTAARGLSRGARDEADVRLGLSAVTALSRLAPADLDARLAPLTAKSVPGPLRARVESAISAGRGGCATASQR